MRGTTIAPAKGLGKETVHTLRTALSCLAVVLAVKALVILLWPGRTRVLLAWSQKVPPAGARCLGAVLLVVGILLAGLAAVQIRNPVIVAGLAAGLVLTVLGAVYQVPRLWRALLQPVASARHAWAMRVLGAFVLMLAVLLGWALWAPRF